VRRPTDSPVRIVAPVRVDSGLAAVGVGPGDRDRFEKLGITTVADLLLQLPFDWESYGAPTPVSRLIPGTSATVVGTLMSISTRRPRQRRKGLNLITEGRLVDEEGEGLNLIWFNQIHVSKVLSRGLRIAVAGLVTARSNGTPSMSRPYFEVLARGAQEPSGIGGMMPKYHLVKGLTSKKITGWVAKALPAADQLEDVLPEDIRRAHHLLPVAEAVRKGHQPESPAEYAEAKERMVFAELFELQAAFAMMRSRQASEPATPIPYEQAVIDLFKAGLGFELTKAQRRSMWEAFQDMARATPMNRLLNGDVGSGKTAVAAACAAMAHAAGQQAVVMAPTEILARQHLSKFRTYLEPSFPDLKVELLISDQVAAERRRVRMSAASGHCALVVGTHALIEDDVEFANLGLAVVDEQHRFGTRQRELLRAKGRGRPHFLAMTATPIPRTLALALYGEMALSVIDELPPGRTPVRTEVVEPADRMRAYDLVRREVKEGRQAFVICPLIEESEKLAVKSATAEFDRLRADVFPDLKLGLLHGRIKDKDGVMSRFLAGDIQVLVATAVVEVGVDVPNATVMMIEGAERFGLAQLHQFRGRVGRGAAKSYCLLLADDQSRSTVERLRLVTATTDGFRLAEEDMRLRGMGEMLGQRQHGMSDFAMNALRQPELVSEIRQAAEALLGSDPGLARHEPLRRAITRRLAVTSIS
jgi:ATP-dependent DNA helicase RecG